jgi:serine/threonine protein phosphatase PrpC
MNVLFNVYFARDAFLVLACDGVWDVLTSQEAVEFVYRSFQEEVASGRSVTEDIVAKVSDSLVQECLNRGSTDNISVVLVTFPALEKNCLEIIQRKSCEEQEEEGVKDSGSSSEATSNELKQSHTLEPSPPPVNVNMVLADMNKNLPPSSPMKGTRLF